MKAFLGRRMRARLGLRVKIGVALVAAVFGVGLAITVWAGITLRADRVDSSKGVAAAIARSGEDDFAAMTTESPAVLDAKLTRLVNRSPGLTAASLYVLDHGHPSRVASSRYLSATATSDPVDAGDVLPLRTAHTSYREHGTEAELGFPLERNGRPFAVLGLYLDLRPLQRTVAAHERQMLVVFFLAALLVAAIALYVLERALLRPLAQLTAATEAISEGHSGVRLNWPHRGELGRVGSVFDRMAEAVEERESLQELSMTDSLTLISNHRAFHAALDMELARCRRHGGRMSIVLMDLDGFKLINDTRGHARGDELLADVAQTLRAGCRPSDTVARVGGDEFALLLPETDREAATTVAGRLIDSIALLERGVGASFGVAEWPADAADKLDLLRHADRGLYAGKALAHSSRGVIQPAAPGLAHDLAGPAVADPGLTPDERIRRILGVARTELRMDIAYVSAFDSGDQVLCVLAGDSSSFGLEPGTRVALRDSYCRRVVDGEIPNVIPDTSEVEALRELPATTEGLIGSYVGVPLQLSNGELYGTLCCASHDPSPTIRDRDISFMQVLARLISDEIEHEALETERRRLSTVASTVDALLAALNARDNYTSEHSECVVELATGVAARLGLSPAAVDEVGQAALLHDIGKLAVPDAVLHKRGPLDEDEWRIMREHPAHGAALIGAVTPLASLAPVIRAEHERWDGLGYPDGLAGESIPLPARIVFACDAYHAMTSDRPYRRAMSAEAAREELATHSGTQFDPAVIEALLDVLTHEHVASARA